MTKLLTEISSRKFTNRDKHDLYHYITKDLRNYTQEYRNNLSSFIAKLVKTRLLNPDLEYILNNKNYCAKTRSISLDSDLLGLPKRYDEGVKRCKSVSVEVSYYLNDLDGKPVYVINYAKENEYYYQYRDITEDLLASCTKDEIHQLKEHIMEFSRLQYKLLNYGVEHNIKSAGELFPGISTWGQLNDRFPETDYIEYLIQARGLTVSKEIQLLKELKLALGY